MKKELIFDEYVNFEKEYVTHFEELWSLFGCVEGIENAFDIEVSCGDGKFLSDIEDDEELLDKYDGNVCLKTPPRINETKKLMNGTWRFRVWVEKDAVNLNNCTVKLSK